MLGTLERDAVEQRVADPPASRANSARSGHERPARRRAGAGGTRPHSPLRRWLALGAGLALCAAIAGAAARDGGDVPPRSVEAELVETREAPATPGSRVDRQAGTPLPSKACAPFLLFTVAEDGCSKAGDGAKP